MTFYVLGIGNRKPNFTAQQMKIISSGVVFSGGMRHFNLVKDILPKAFKWIYIKSPMNELFEAYEKQDTDVVIFASGNPLFYGFSNTLKQRYPKSNIITTPYFSSIELLANKTNTTTNDLVSVSVHGRGWTELDSALIKQERLIGVLTDAKNTPSHIAKRLLDYGYSNYSISIGEDLEGNQENIQTLTLIEAVASEFNPLNCVLLHRIDKRTLPFGINDDLFLGLPGRPKMITKMPIRLTTLHLLDVVNASVFWDIGYCTGSVSIEAKLRNSDLDIIAFEKRLECKNILLENQKRFGTPGIKAVIGDFFNQNLRAYKCPDVVFIGGHGGRLNELLDRLNSVLKPKAKVVLNAVKTSSILTFKESCIRLNWKLEEDLTISLDEHNPICLLKASKI